MGNRPPVKFRGGWIACNRQSIRHENITFDQKCFYCKTLLVTALGFFLDFRHSGSSSPPIARIPGGIHFILIMFLGIGPEYRFYQSVTYYIIFVKFNMGNAIDIAKDAGCRHQTTFLVPW
jgi:hypothetical protein